MNYTRYSDDGDAPKNSIEVKLFPVCPPVKFGLWAEIEEPAKIVIKVHKVLLPCCQRTPTPEESPLSFNQDEIKEISNEEKSVTKGKNGSKTVENTSYGDSTKKN
jgi:hypothetical protein